MTKQFQNIFSRFSLRASARRVMLLLAVLMVGVNAWGESVNFKGSDRCFKNIVSDTCTLYQATPPSHVTFFLVKKSGSKFEEKNNQELYTEGNDFRLFWSVDRHYDITVTAVSIKAAKYTDWAWTNKDFHLGDRTLNSPQYNKFTFTNNSEQTFGISSLSYGRTDSVPMYKGEYQLFIKEISISYTLTPYTYDFEVNASCTSDGVAFASFTEDSYTSNHDETTVNGAILDANTHATAEAYFYATPLGDNHFEGWYESESDFGDVSKRLSTNANFSKEIANTTPNSTSAYTLYAHFVTAYTPEFYDLTDLDLKVGDTHAFSDDNFYRTSTAQPSASESNFYLVISDEVVTTSNVEGSGSPTRVISYDGTKLTALNKGTAIITFKQKAVTNQFVAGEYSISVSVDKNPAPVLSLSDPLLTSLSWSHTYNDPFSSENSDYSSSPLSVSPMNPNVATWDAINNRIVVYAGDVPTVKFKVNQNENYKYLAAEETEFTFDLTKVVDGTCYLKEIGGGENGNNIKDEGFKTACAWSDEEDVAGMLYFKPKSDHSDHGIFIYQTIDGYDYTVDYINGSVGSSFPSDPLYKTLDPAAKKVWFKAKGNGNRFIKDFSVTRRTYISVSSDRIEFPTILPNTSSERNVIVHWSCSDGGDIHAISSNNKFSVRLTTDDPTTIPIVECSSGNNEISIVYSPTEIHKEDTAYITIYNSSHKATILATGNTAQTIGEGVSTVDNEPEGTFRWRVDAPGTNWSDANNWLVYSSKDSNKKYYSTNSAPLDNSTVLIPAGCTNYPVIQEGDICRQIYVQAGGRIQDQHKLKYDEAFVDVEVDNNRYVRITPPLQNVYSGDFFTKWQGGSWSNFEPSSYNGTPGTEGPNRVFNSAGYGQTYISLFASASEVIDKYGLTSTEVRMLDDESGWTNPANGLGQRFDIGESFDVWMDNDNQSTSTFHFPCADKTFYYYIRQDGRLGNRISIDRSARVSQGRFAYDMFNTTSSGLMEQVLKHSITGEYPMFAIGNPSLAYMDVKKFMQQNVVQGYITPYFYKSSPVDGDRSTDEVYYFVPGPYSLYRVTSFDVDGKPQPNTEDANRVSSLYVNPGEGFRVMAGETEVYSAEYELMGEYSSNVSYYHYFGVHVLKSGITDRDFVQAGGEIKNNGAGPDERFRNIGFAIIADKDDPFKVYISNFVGRGYVQGIVDPVNHLIRIKNGTEVCKVTTGNGWTGTRVLRVYGCTSSRIKFGERFFYHSDVAETYKVENIDPAATDGTGDIIIDYDINEETNKVKLSLRYPFVLYSEAFAKNLSNPIEVSEQYSSTNTPMVGDHIKEECEAFFVYDSISAERTFTDPSDDFILPAALGTYKTPIVRIYNDLEIYDPRDNHQIVSIQNPDDGNDNASSTTDDNYYGGIRIRRMTGSNNIVLIKGLYPGDTECSVIGCVSRVGDTYYLSIPSGQKVHDAGTEDLYDNYYLYLCHEGDIDSISSTIKLIWDGTNKTWSQITKDKRDNKAFTIPLIGQEIGRYYYTSQISHLSDVVGYGGFRLAYHKQYLFGDFDIGNSDSWKTYDRFTLTRIGDDQGIESASASSDPSKESKFQVRFTSDMFVANLPGGGSGAPQRTHVDVNGDTEDDGLIFISATTTDGYHANTLLVIDEKAHKNYNSKEDAPLFDVANANLCFGTLAGSQLVAVNVFDELDTIPLFITQNATLKFRNVSQLGTDVVLFDAIESTYTPLYDGIQVNVTIGVGEEAGRYFICHAPTSPENTTDVTSVVETNWKPIAYSPTKGSIVLNTCIPDLVTTKLFTITGALLQTTIVETTTSFSNLTPGLYIVQVDARNQSKQIKVMVY